MLVVIAVILGAVLVLLFVLGARRHTPAASMGATRSKKTTVAETILLKLIEHSTTVFGVCGAAWYPFDDVLAHAHTASKLRYVHMSNETAACLAASQFGSKAGVAITTAGPGTTTAITGMACANKEERPLVCICGVPSQLDAHGFQFIETALVNSVVKHTFMISSTINTAEQVAKIIEDAFHTAEQGTRQDPGPGTVVVFVDVDSWLAQISPLASAVFRADHDWLRKKLGRL